MSSEPNEDRISTFEEETIATGQAGQQRKRGLSPASKIGIVVGGGAIAVTLALMLASPQQSEPTRLSRPPTLDTTPSGANQAASPEFQESIRANNERRAEVAAQRGITSMPTPEVILEPVQRIDPMRDIPVVEPRTAEAPPAPRPQTRRILPSPAPAERVTQAQPQAQPQQQPAAQPSGNQAGAEQAENPHAEGIAAQMDFISRRMVPMAMVSNTIAVSRTDESQLQAGQSAAPASGNGAAAEAEGEVIIRPGDILYGETLTSVTSDMASPVLVEITTGEYKGARLVGEFTADRAAARLVVSFQNMTLEDGTVLSINAFAVDGRSAETAVASDVERRLLARYGPILAASFIATYADAMSEPGRVVSGSGTEIDVVLDPRTRSQALFAGLGAASQVISQDVMAHAPRGPLIRLRSGFPLALLFVDPVTVE